MLNDPLWLGDIAVRRRPDKLVGSTADYTKIILYPELSFFALICDHFMIHSLNMLSMKNQAVSDKADFWDVQIIS